MSAWWIALLALGLAAGALAWLLLRPSVRRMPPAAGRAASSRQRRALEHLDTVADWPPEATRLLNLPERQVHRLLNQALPDHLVLAQVPLARFLRVPAQEPYGEWMRRVGQQCADLLVCDRHTQPLAVVMVDTGRPAAPDVRSEGRRARMERVLSHAGLRLLHLQEGRLPHPVELRQQVLGPRAGAIPASNDSLAPHSGLPDPSAARPANLLRPLAELDNRPEVTELHDPPPSFWFEDTPSDAAAQALGADERPTGSGR